MAMKRRVRTMKKSALSDSWRYFLETGGCLSAIDKNKFPDISNYDKFHIFQLGNPRPGSGYWEKLRKIWMQHREEILSDWKSQKKKGLRWAETLFNERKEAK